MVNVGVKPVDQLDKQPPDIFRAALNDDPIELRAALADGQSLDYQHRRFYNMTPMHLACAKHSLEFLKVAISEKFNAWARDSDGRVSMDYAVAEGLDEVAEELLAKLYPKDVTGRPMMPF